ncbi:signal peptide peptidase SppA [Ferrovum sp.]|uniref:signal peptide peptidase SppA n=1 Tax=Ferrovum sp. TaxID=2609467 RepID=UPI0026329F87|nr:signal peptide peptidase SppA [Ferrovum sp.]
MASLFRWLGRSLYWIWRGLMGFGQLAVSLVFVLLLAASLTTYLSNRIPAPRPKTTLVIDLNAHLVEQAAPRTDNLLSASLLHQTDSGDIELRDVLAALDAAAQDPAIDRVLLKTDGLQVSGIAILHEVAHALDHFRKTGKPVIAWADHYDQRQYFLAAHADRLYLDPLGQVLFQGFGHYRNYYRDALDRLGIKVNLIRVGTYKSFGESYVANGPSPAALEADQTLYHALWADFDQAIENARHQPAGMIDQSIDHLPQDLAALQGNAAKLALSQHWVDALVTPDELTNLLKKNGHEDGKAKDFRQISLDDYVSRLPDPKSDDGVAVIVAEGEIQDGDAPAGTIGGTTTADLVRAAREDDQVKALVLRVDSPGGSAHASELIRRELALTQAAGKPVVVSMGNLAASGGYWLSLSADEVIADPDTVTGSIGVFALIPTADGLMNKAGIHTGGVTTTWLSDADNLLRPLNPRFTKILQSSVNHLYQDFIQRTATARRLSPQAVDTVAQGRVWTGAQALNYHLIDHLGLFQDALKSARKRAHLAENSPVHYYDPNPSPWQRWLNLIGQSLLPDPLVTWLSQGTRALNPALAVSSSPQMRTDLGVLIGPLLKGTAPFIPLTHCLCQIP